MKILVFDNYDSFTYNLVHLVEKILHQKVDVYRNDQIPLEDVKAYDKIILSPGPGIPEEAGLLLPLIKEYAASKSILGVCLGHQAIGQAFGGKLTNLSTVYHGVATPVQIVNRQSAIGNREKANPDQSGQAVKRETGKSKKQAETSTEVTHSPLPTHHSLFDGLPDEFEVGRYHSWVVSEDGFPKDLEITARDANNFIMALQHKTYDVQGVQFHPESVLTPRGEEILRNWLKS
ncbi:aminodeoxychorismate/anthranilate synthase component II [Niastella koreensis]|uniref:Anthranilate synthase, component II n=2 Tax=Niastella koreensis TaxID=354356 RepID=G8TQM1_NIAKG|nr:aminodeoxychorismate/anthranilate synthase component II [Niastella koreensis]AEV96755.1 anthranilate synthase, component II [Niastella koreensis GR20-10]OQP49112.1 aminodeoxychorismate/anthranilate synthase component II [Niastella koreensis]